MRKLGYNLDFGLHKKFTLIYLFISQSIPFLLLLITYCLFFSVTMWNNFWVFFPQFILNASNLMLFAVHVFLLVNTKVRYHQLNTFLRYCCITIKAAHWSQQWNAAFHHKLSLYLKIIFRESWFATNQLSQPSSTFTCISGDKYTYMINKIAQLHDKLTDVIGLINKCYSSQVGNNIFSSASQSESECSSPERLRFVVGAFAWRSAPITNYPWNSGY